MKLDTDKIQTYMGFGEAILIGIIDYLVHAHAVSGGFEWDSPTFWGGITLAVSRAVKGYFAAGVKDKEEVKV